MDVISVCPLRAAPFVWEPRPSAWVLTVIVKATYTLRAGESLLAPEQEPLHDDDEHWNRDPSHSVRAPADLVPVKPNPEVMVSGHVFAPGGQPTRALTARLAVGSVDKRIEVFCDRTIGPDGAIHNGLPWKSFPIVYERSAGGPGTTNPVGMPPARDASGHRALPNVTKPGASLAGPDAPLEPSGFGPIAADWPSRTEKLGSHRDLAHGSIRGKVLPPDVDMSFFSQAPPDQQLTALHEDEWLALENLHPTEPRLVTRLPGLRPVLFVDRPGRAPQKISMRADTLWIDTDRAIVTLTFRAPVSLETPDEPGRVLVTMDPPGLESKWEDIERLAEQRVPRRASSLPPPPQSTDGKTPARGISGAPVGHETVVWQAGPTSLSHTTPPPAPSPPEAPRRAEVMIELVAFESAAIPRIRRVAGFAPLLAAAQSRARDVDIDEPREGEPLPQIAERRDVFEILARAEPLEQRALAALLEGAIRDDGKFVPPLALFAGELEPRFDPVAELRTAMALVARMESADLAKELDSARAALASREAPCPAGLAKEHLARLRKTLGMTRDADGKLFEEQLREALVTDRHYDRLAVFGETFVRADLFFPDRKAPFVAYLPASLDKSLPLFRRFGVRVLCEVHLRMDEREAEPISLRVLALARVTRRPDALLDSKSGSELADER